MYLTKIKQGIVHMTKGFKSLNADRKINVVLGGFLFCMLYAGLSVLMDSLVFNKPNAINPVASDVDIIDKVYVVDGKTYNLKQKVTLLDGSLVVETIEDVK